MKEKISLKEMYDLSVKNANGVVVPMKTFLHSMMKNHNEYKKKDLLDYIKSNDCKVDDEEKKSLLNYVSSTYWTIKLYVSDSKKQNGKITFNYHD